MILYSVREQNTGSSSPTLKVSAFAATSIHKKCAGLGVEGQKRFDIAIDRIGGYLYPRVPQCDRWRHETPPPLVCFVYWTCIYLSVPLPFTKNKQPAGTAGTVYAYDGPTTGLNSGELN